jgi:Iron-containing redox enzyme
VATASARLRRKLDLVLPEFATPGRLLLEGPRARELCPRFLASGSYVTLAMVPLMETALERARVLAADDPVAGGLVGYLERHIPEELHGGAPGRAALDDLEALGVNTAALVARPPPPEMAALIGTLYFWICHRHPVAILGLLELEAFHPHAPTVERLIEKTGLPRDGFRQLLLHSEVDVRHGQELQDVVDTLSLEPWHEQLIGLSALQTMWFLIDAWLDVLAADAGSPTVAEPGLWS